MTSKVPLGSSETPDVRRRLKEEATEEGGQGKRGKSERGGGGEIGKGVRGKGL